MGAPIFTHRTRVAKPVLGVRPGGRGAFSNLESLGTGLMASYQLGRLAYPAVRYGALALGLI